MAGRSEPPPPEERSADDLENDRNDGAAPAPSVQTDNPRCVCGHSLASAVTPEGVTLHDGTYLRFRRRTDYMMCGQCLRLYRTRDLGTGNVKPLSEIDLLAD